MPLVHYESPDEDSARWQRVVLRDDDIVISTRSKHGTTWLQQVCALLVFRGTDLPAPLPVLSPWVDWLVEPIDEVVARLDAQQHRRILKSHTPLDGLPVAPRATWVVGARHPLDAAVSLYHQGRNIDRARRTEVTGRPDPVADRPPPPLAEWLRDWIEWDGPAAQRLDSLPGVAHHLADAWSRRHHDHVVLVHYADLLADLDGQMRSLASTLGERVPELDWPSLVEAATFRSMQARAGELVPDPAGVLRDHGAFFRRGSSGAAREVLDNDALAAYDTRMRSLLPDDLNTWLHR